MRSWLVLLHSLPPEPAYLRVKLRRRLARLGAVPLKSSVYVLPNRGDALEDFQWLASEIRGDGGEAVLCEANVLDGASDDDLIGQFNDQASALYAGVEADARDALNASDRANTPPIRAPARGESTRASPSSSATPPGSTTSAPPLAMAQARPSMRCETRGGLRPSKAVKPTHRQRRHRGVEASGSRVPTCLSTASPARGSFGDSSILARASSS